MKNHENLYTQLFVSSTFRDMQSERDAIQNIVLPNLNAEAYKFGESVSICDLRWGINTDGMDELTASKKILSICLDEIDISDPPFVVILGERYGWMPNGDLIKDVASYKKFQLESYEISVTALEILYGQGVADKTLVYFREFRNGPMSSDYFCEDEIHRAKLNELKIKINGLVQGNIKTYYVDFDGNEVNSECMAGFAKALTCDILDYLKPVWNKKNNNPFKIERQRHNNYFAEKANLFSARYDDLKQILNLIINEDKHNLSITGDSGSGKSALISKLNLELKQNDVKQFITFPFECGLTDKCINVDSLIEEIAKCLNVSFNLDSYDEKFSPESNMVNLIKLIPSNQNVCILIDGVEQLLKDEARDKLLFLPNEIHDNIYFVYSITPNTSIKYSDVSNYNLKEMSDQDVLCVLDSMLKSNHKNNLPSYVTDAILRKVQTRNPLHLSFLVQRLMLMGKNDFDIINSTGGTIDTISNYQLGIISTMSTDILDSASDLLNDIGKVIGQNFVKKVTQYIAVSRYGLRTIDLAILIGDDWNELDFKILTNRFKEFFQIRPDGRYDFFHKSLRESILRECDKKSLHFQIFRMLNSLTWQDPIRKQELIFHCIQADCGENNINKKTITPYQAFVSNYIYECKNKKRNLSLSCAAENIYYSSLKDEGKWILNLIKYFKPQENTRICDIFNKVVNFISDSVVKRYKYTVNEQDISINLSLEIMKVIDEHTWDNFVGVYSNYLSKSSLLGRNSVVYSIANKFFDFGKEFYSEGKIDDQEYFHCLYLVLSTLKSKVNLTPDGMKIHALCNDVFNEAERNHLFVNEKISGIGEFHGCFGEIAGRLGNYEKQLMIYRQDLSYRVKNQEKSNTRDGALSLFGGLANVGSALTSLEKYDEAMPYLIFSVMLNRKNRAFSNDKGFYAYCLAHGYYTYFKIVECILGKNNYVNKNERISTILDLLWDTAMDYCQLLITVEENDIEQTVMNEIDKRITIDFRAEAVLWREQLKEWIHNYVNGDCDFGEYKFSVDIETYFNNTKKELMDKIENYKNDIQYSTVTEEGIALEPGSPSSVYYYNKKIRELRKQLDTLVPDEVQYIVDLLKISGLM